MSITKRTIGIAAWIACMAFLVWCDAYVALIVVSWCIAGVAAFLCLGVFMHYADKAIESCTNVATAILRIVRRELRAMKRIQ
jgi:hypothetical protein